MRHVAPKRTKKRNMLTAFIGGGLLLFLLFIGGGDRRALEQGVEAAAGDMALAGKVQEDQEDIAIFHSSEPVIAPDLLEPSSQEAAETIRPGAEPGELRQPASYHVPATDRVGERYFRDALFIGDSRVMGLMLYSGLTEATFYTEKGINVKTLLTKPIVPQTGGGKLTVLQALEQQQFGKIYIKIGLNELGWAYPSSFIEAYSGAIDQIRALQPEAVFYVQSILPVSAEKDAGDNVFTNQRIAEFNNLIQKMAREKGLQYLDATEWFADDQGCLPEEAGHDGIHLNKEYCKVWLDFLKRHTLRDYSKVRL